MSPAEAEPCIGEVPSGMRRPWAAPKWRRKQLRPVDDLRPLSHLRREQDADWRRHVDDTFGLIRELTRLRVEAVY